MLSLVGTCLQDVVVNLNYKEVFSLVYVCKELNEWYTSREALFMLRYAIERDTRFLTSDFNLKRLWNMSRFVCAGAATDTTIVDNLWRIQQIDGEIEK